MQIKIKYHADIEKIKKIAVGDWVDLRCAEDTFIPVGGFKLISLGISMELPDGYEAHILPRSSTFIRYGILLVNGMGIIDNSYHGNNDVWHFGALCQTGVDFIDGQRGVIIPKNARICQFRIMPKQEENIEFVEVDRLDGQDRGGLGSTGV